MSAKEQFVMLPKSLLEGSAWRNLSINGHRLLHFLMLEHLRHGGKENGNLLAPYRQLQQFGITQRLIPTVIAELEESGLVICRHGSRRTPNTYGLAWLKLALPSEVKAKARVLLSEGKADCIHNGRQNTSFAPRSECKDDAIPPFSLPSEVNDLSRVLYHGGKASKISQEEEKDSLVFDVDGLPPAAAAR